MIRFVDVKKSFGDRQILKGVSFDVKRGEVLFIVGASGAGKSVMIKHLIGLIRPDEGEIWLDDLEVSRLSEEALYPVRKRCAMVFQHATLFDSMTCLDNVALPLLKHKRLGAKQAREEALRRLRAVHMEDVADEFPAMIGDGMRKRVAIARALTLDPEYVLFDEPTTSLDPVSARRVDALIRQLSDEMRVTSIVVSHDLRSIFDVADRIVMLYQGHVRLWGTPHDFRTSTDPIIEQFTNGRADGPMEI